VETLKLETEMYKEAKFINLDGIGEKGIELLNHRLTEEETKTFNYRHSPGMMVWEFLDYLSKEFLKKEKWNFNENDLFFNIETWFEAEGDGEDFSPETELFVNFYPTCKKDERWMFGAGYYSQESERGYQECGIGSELFSDETYQDEGIIKFLDGGWRKY
jgi:hypothetical protein